MRPHRMDDASDSQAGRIAHCTAAHLKARGHLALTVAPVRCPARISFSRISVRSEYFL